MRKIQTFAFQSQGNVYCIRVLPFISVEMPVTVEDQTMLDGSMDGLCM